MGLNVHGLKFKTVVTLLGFLAIVLLIHAVILTPAIRKRHASIASASQEGLVRQIAAVIDFSFRQAMLEIENMAKLPEIRSMEKKRIDRLLTGMNKALQFFNYYFVLDKNGKWVSHPEIPYLVGQSIPEQNMGWVRKTIEEDKTIFLDVVKTRVNTLVSGFSTPIHNDKGETLGLLRGVLVTTEENTVLSTIRNTRIGKNGYAYIVSANGWLIAHSKKDLTVGDLETYDYKRYDPINKCINGEYGTLDYEYEGEMWVASFAPMASTGWCVIVQQPRSDILEAVKKESKLFTVMYLYILLVGFLMLTSVMKITLKPLSRLVESLRMKRISEDDKFSADEVGQIAKEFHSLYTELSSSEEKLRKQQNLLEELVFERTRNLIESNKRLEKEIEERERAEKRIRDSLDEKEVLLKEIHHRVRNNMQIIISMLKLQSNLIEDMKCIDILNESQNRIKAMALVHERLYMSKDLSKINFREYIDQLVSGVIALFESESGLISIKNDVENVYLGIDTCIPCGIIVSELVSNAIKYAFPEGREGIVRISLTSFEDKMFELSISDNGIGLPEGLDFEYSEGLGLRLVSALARMQLQGEVFVNTDKGTEIILRFRELIYKERI